MDGIAWEIAMLRERIQHAETVETADVARAFIDLCLLLEHAANNTTVPAHTHWLKTYESQTSGDVVPGGWR